MRIPHLLRFASPYLVGYPEFYGPAHDSIKFAIGPIFPEPSISQHQTNVAAIAMRHGHRVVEVSTIDAAGKLHATMVVDVPPFSFWSRRLKNYFLIFGGTEYVVTASLEASEEEYDRIVKTFRPI